MLTLPGSSGRNSSRRRLRVLVRRRVTGAWGVQSIVPRPGAAPGPAAQPGTNHPPTPQWVATVAGARPQCHQPTRLATRSPRRPGRAWRFGAVERCWGWHWRWCWVCSWVHCTGAIAVRSGSSRAHWWVPRRVLCSVGSRPEAARGEIRHDRQRADPLCRAIVARPASVVHSQPQRESVAAERKQLNAIATSSIPREFHESIMTGDISGHTCLRFSVLTLLPQITFGD